MRAVREPSWFITDFEAAIRDLREVVSEIAASINSDEDIRTVALTNLDASGGGTGDPHNLLDSGDHLDTVSQGPTQGSLIKGNGTPKWDELLLGAAELPLHVNAGVTDLEYSALKVAGGGTGLTALVTNDIIYASSALTFGTLASNPLATAKFLRTVSGGPPEYHQVAWGDLDLTASDLADLATRSHADLTGVTANQHHNQSHVLATNVALGPDHTISGTSAGQVLRASGAAAANFQQLAWGDLDLTVSDLADLATRAHSSLTGVTANQHHNQSHVLATNVALGPDHTISGGVAGMVLRASGAAAANFAFLGADDLPDVDALYTSLIDGQIAHSDGTNLVGNSDLLFDRATEYLGINTSTLAFPGPGPQVRLHVIDTVGAFPTIEGPPWGIAGIFQRNGIVGDPCGVIIIGGASSSSSLYFGRAADADVGAITYNHVNDSWSVVVNAAPALTINSTQKIQASVDGSETVPVWTYTSETGMGLWRVGAGALGVSCASAKVFEFNSTEIISNPDGDDRDFRVQTTADTHSFFVHGATGNIGIEYATPSRTIDARVPEAVINLQTLTDDPAYHAMIFLDVKNSAGGLAQTRYKHDTVDKWAHGLDPSDSDTWKLGQHGNCDTNVRLSVTTAGFVGINNDDPQGPIDIYRNVTDHYSIFRWGTEAVNQGPCLRFMVAAPGVVPAHANILADIRCLVRSTPPDPLESSIQFFVNKGDALTQMMRIQSDEGVIIQDGVSVNPAARLQVVGDIWAGTVSGEFRVSTSGDLSRIRNVPYVWPAADAAGVLTSDGAGNLSWVAGGGVSGSGGSGQVTFWTGAATVSGEAAFYWDATDDCLCLGTAGVDIDNTVLTIGSTDGCIGFKHDITTPPTADTHIGAGTYSAIDVLFIRSSDSVLFCLDYDDDDAASYFRIIRDGPDPGTGGIVTLLNIDESANCIIGDFSQSGSIGLSAFAAGGVAALLSQTGSPTSGAFNRVVLENTVSAGTAMCHLELTDGWLMWDPAADTASAAFHSGTDCSKIGPMTSGGIDLLVFESLGNVEVVIDSDDDTTAALFRITRNNFWNGADNLFYHTGIPWPGETLFTVNEDGLVYTPARKIHRKAIADAAYTLDTWANFDGVDDLLIAYTSLTAARTVTLPAAAAGNLGRMICIKDESGNAGTFNISVSQAVEGGGTPTALITTNYGYQWLYSSGGAWFKC